MVLKELYHYLEKISIDEIVYQTALKYTNLFRGRAKLSMSNPTSEAKARIISKSRVGYYSKSSDEVVLFATIPDYIMENPEGEYFFFRGSPQVGRNFRLNDDNISFTGPPMVLGSQPYNHPFVKSDNEICYSNDGRWQRKINVTFGFFYNACDTSNKGTFFKIAIWLYEGEIALKRGYFGNVTPVHELNKGNFLNEYLTPTQAKSSGIEVIPYNRKN